MPFFKCITGLLSENPLGVNVLASAKDSLNLQKVTFLLLFHHFLPNWVRKSSFQSDLRFQDSLVKRWLETTSILVVIERIYCYQFKSNYVRNHQLFSLFGFNFCDLHEISKVLQKKKMGFIGQVFLKLLTPKNVLISMHNRASFWKSFGSENVNDPPELVKSSEKLFYPTFSSFWAKFS